MDVSQKSFTEPSIFVDLSEHGSILAVHLSPYEWNQDIILIAFKNKIFVGQIVFSDTIELKKIAEFHHNVICTALYLSPTTMLNVLPVNIQFATAGKDDFVLRIFKGNLEQSNTCKLLRGHTKYINDLCYDHDNTYLASVSDDNTAKVWGVSDYECIATFTLTSPGLSTFWHRDDESKLLVAEKSGVIRFYNVTTQRPILSFDVGRGLSAADWAPSNPQLIVSLNKGQLVLWDSTKPSCPKQGTVYPYDGGYIKFSPLGELVATLNKLEGSVKVIHLATKQTRLSAKVTLPTNICWHFRLPLLCLGDDRMLRFWKVISK